MSDTDLQIALMEAGRMNLMHLPPGAIAWLWDRPKKQIDAAEDLAVSANAHGNPVVDASLLKADQNIMLIKCEGGECFRIYPDGGFSHEDTPMDIGGCASVLQGMGGGDCPMDDCGHAMDAEPMPDPMDDGMDDEYALMALPDMDGMGDMMDMSMGEDEGDVQGNQTYWLYLHGNHVASVRLPAGASDHEVRRAAMDQQDRAPGVSHLYPEHNPDTIRSMIHHSEVRMHEDMGEDEDDIEPELKHGDRIAKIIQDACGEQDMEEDSSGALTGAASGAGMGTGSPYVGDTDMYNDATMGQSIDASEQLDNQMMSRELGEFRIKDLDDDVVEEIAEALGLQEINWKGMAMAGAIGLGAMGGAQADSFRMQPSAQDAGGTPTEFVLSSPEHGSLTLTSDQRSRVNSMIKRKTDEILNGMKFRDKRTKRRAARGVKIKATNEIYTELLQKYGE